jgi:hypothetical protein
MSREVAYLIGLAIVFLFAIVGGTIILRTGKEKKA